MCRGLGAGTEGRWPCAEGTWPCAEDWHRGTEGVSGVLATVGPGQGRRMGTPPWERGSHLLRGLGASMELEGQRLGGQASGGQVMPSAVNWGPEDWGAGRC